MKWMFVPLRRYAQFSGRARRMEYWMFTLFQVLVYFAVMILMLLVGGAGIMMGGDIESLGAVGIGAAIVLILYALFSLAMIIPSIAVGVRRLHDTGRTGWWLLAPLAPYLLMIAAMALLMNSPDLIAVAGIITLVSILAVLGLGVTVFVFLVLEGTRGPNRFGEDPKGGAASEIFA